MNMKDDREISREERLEEDYIDEKNWMNEDVNPWINDDWIELDWMRNDWMRDDCWDRIACKIDCVTDAWTSYCNVWRSIESWLIDEIETKTRTRVDVVNWEVEFWLLIFIFFFIVFWFFFLFKRCDAANVYNRSFKSEDEFFIVVCSWLIVTFHLLMWSLNSL
jgi:hypothetical protein